ncbi:hypothetical protein EUTSA_v10001717mg [Eutrema salsugineum]|uniref:Glycylpeptide N-tetradecanoyltransferase n=2 Tax=Eutrema salsugineum TaxID=72664 RepID=V4L6Q2_EUTSA|nr:hypothetical protein EUTSA_v10001717mg [Eutrema salsugineum]
MEEDTAGGSKSQLGSAKETAYPIHKFWETQPVVQYKDIGDTSLPEGPIEPATQLSEVRQVPYKLPTGLKWTTCDLSDDDMLTEVWNFLNNYLCEEYYNRRYILSKEYLRWILLPPGYKQSLHVGVRADTPNSKNLLGLIAGVPTKIRLRGEVVTMAKTNLLCVHKDLRSKGITPFMIKEVTRRAQLANIWQGVYCSRKVVPTPITTCKNWLRFLDPKKLIEIGLTTFGPRMNMKRIIRLYSLPDAPLTPGFRRMEPHDVSAVEGLLNDYLRQFRVAAHFDYLDVAHWFETKEDVVESYVVANPETGDVTDFCSFTILNYSIHGNPKHTTMKAAYSYYNVATKTSFVQLMKDALIVSKQKNCDVFFAADVMHNESFFKELKFREGDAEGSHYYLYNYRLRSALKPSELGLVLI